MGWIWNTGSEIRDPERSYPGSPTPDRVRIRDSVRQNFNVDDDLAGPVLPGEEPGGGRQLQQSQDIQSWMSRPLGQVKTFFIFLYVKGTESRDGFGFWWHAC